MGCLQAFLLEVLIAGPQVTIGLNVVQGTLVGASHWQLYLTTLCVLYLDLIEIFYFLDICQLISFYQCWTDNPEQYFIMGSNPTEPT